MPAAARLMIALSAALVLVTGLGYIASQTIAARPDYGDLSARQYVAAPVPTQVEPTARAGQAVGVPEVDARWLAETSSKTGIPVAALRAYARVQLDGTAGCPVGWTTLAGIGWIESHHGTLGGRTLNDDGTSTPAVIGPALDGHGKFAAIRATSLSAQFHGDQTWEHAVGPLQFLPSTWATYAADGDGDGVSDPFDLDDAAAAAGTYLCATGGDVTTGEGWSQAVLAYNHDTSYVQAVHDAAEEYAVRSR